MAPAPWDVASEEEQLFVLITGANRYEYVPGSLSRAVNEGSFAWPLEFRSLFFTMSYMSNTPG